MLTRHLPTLDDLSDIYTPPGSNVELAPFDEKRLAEMRKEVATIIDEYKIDHAYCSSNLRGIRTAEILLDGLGDRCEVIPDASLGNIDQPEWGNRPQSYVKTTEKYQGWHSHPNSVQFVGGECLQDVKRRIEDFLSKAGGRNIIIISHTTPMQVLVCRLLGIEVDRIWSFKFDHYRFTAIFGEILLRYNAARVADIDFQELKL